MRVIATWLLVFGAGWGCSDGSGTDGGDDTAVAGAGGLGAGSGAGAGGSPPNAGAGQSGAGGGGAAGGIGPRAGSAGDAGRGSGGSPGSGGSAGTAMTAMDAGAAGSAGSGSGGSGGTRADAGAGSCPYAGEGATAHFSFFVTSQAGLERLSGSANGFGGDLRYGEADGLSGADKICRELAEAAYEGAGCKTWRAFLSVTKDASGNPVNAGDRIGSGPWYDRLGRLVAMNKNDLLQAWPAGADPAIAQDLPNEFGVPNHDPDGTGKVDNHNTITGTSAGGMLTSTDWTFTCHDWTSSVGEDGTPRIGFSWKGGAANMDGAMWYASNITEGGCAAIVNTTDSMDFSIRGIGARGGYGGFYCLALEP